MLLQEVCLFNYYQKQARDLLKIWMRQKVVVLNLIEYYSFMAKFHTILYLSKIFIKLIFIKC